MSVTKKIMVGLLVAAAMCSLLWGMGVFAGGEQPVMSMGMQPVKDRQTGRMIMQPAFVFSAPVKIMSLRVYNEKEYAEQGEYAMPVWAIVGNPASEGLREFVYGQPIRKMQLEKKGVRATALVRDERYYMVMKSDRGTYEKRFVYGPKQDEEPGEEQGK